ncbi:hypothetical protein J6590_028939 [Homalodisca vitripennis]|nr:hypothetical protein J6590_028939 [Homalodisca vitripennis]
MRWLTLTSLPTSCSPAPALALATVRSGQTRSEKLTVFWLFSVLPVSPWLANSPTFGRVPVSAVSGTGAASLPEQLKNGMPAPCQRYWTGIQPECSAPIHFFWNKVGLKMCFFTSYTELARTGVQGALPDVRSGGGPVPSQYLFS